jgi:3'-5' exoribonuclease
MLNLNANDTLENQPVIVRQISKKVSQNAREYYHLQISYGIKNFDAKIWTGDNEIAQEITPGCFAYISGVARDFKGNLQIHIHKIDKISDPDNSIIEAVMPCCNADESALHTSINSVIDTVIRPELNSLLKEIFESPDIKSNFYKKAAGAEIHHAYVGGLAQHTIEVAKTVVHFSKIFIKINHDVAVTAALLHDIGKVFELSNFPENKYTTKGRLVGHIALGVEILNDAAAKIAAFPDNLLIDLEHCILSHHGTLEMGSPVVPMTLEAIALHNADKASAEINGFTLAIERDSGADNWTDYNSTYKRFIKKSI